MTRLSLLLTRTVQIVGGLHLAGPELIQRIEPTVKFLKNGVKPARPTFVLPLHCTGLAAKVALANAFGEGCVAAGVGMRARIEKPKGAE